MIYRNCSSIICSERDIPTTLVCAGNLDNNRQNYIKTCASTMVILHFLGLISHKIIEIVEGTFFW